MMLITRQRLTPTLGLILALFLTLAVYWPGLSGSYLFDDYPNIVDNHDLRIDSVTVSSLTRAALSSPSSEFRRPLASLSFATNIYLTDLNPFWMKLTNLIIHLLNGTLIYLLALELIQISSLGTRKNISENPKWLALLIASGWLLLPINLTAVLYVVQRMESLANLFVLLGLLGYVRARRSMMRSGRGFFFAATSILTASAIGLMSKETAAMTPLYAGLIEWILFRTRSLNSHRDSRVIYFFLVTLLAPLIVGLPLLLSRYLSSGAWSTRNFDMAQRLLTETRVVMDYIQWTLLPTPQALSFYHDNYSVSTDWLHPWSTLACAVSLAALITLIVNLRRHAPLVALGLSLFVGSQLLTGTFIPLELVYEHRNYFASFGLLLALIPVLSTNAEKIPAVTARHLFLGGLMILWAIATTSTAMAWGSPTILARTLAERAPDSPRAQYGLGYNYIVLSNYDPKSPFFTAAFAPLEKAIDLHGASILPEHALIILNTCCVHQPVKAEWWDSLIGKLKSQKPSAQDEGALESLVACAGRKECALDPSRMIDAFLAALSHPNPSARLLGVYGLYAWNVLGDRTLGLSMLHEAVNAAPGEMVYRTRLIQMLIVDGHRDEAIKEIDTLESFNIAGRFDPDIAKFRSQLNTKAKQGQATVGTEGIPKTATN